MDDDQEEADLVRAAFADALQRLGHNPERGCFLIPSKVAAEILKDATGEARPPNKASAYLKTLGITELRKSDRSDARGWVWSGRQSTPGVAAVPIRERNSWSDGQR